jgi:hypothetical protein
MRQIVAGPGAVNICFAPAQSRQKNSCLSPHCLPVRLPWAFPPQHILRRTGDIAHIERDALSVSAQIYSGMQITPPI